MRCHEPRPPPTPFSSPRERAKLSTPKVKVALALAGVILTDDELHIIEDGFRSDRNYDMVRIVHIPFFFFRFPDLASHE